MDPLERLRNLNPVDPDDLATEASSVEVDEALEQIVAGKRKPRRLRRRLPRFHRRTWVLVLVPAAAVTATVAWALSQGATQHLAIGCYQRVDLQANTVVVAATEGSPTDVCADVWCRGELGQPVPSHLQACVLPSGAIGVFPSPAGHACETLKLEPREPTATTTPTTTTTSTTSGHVGSPIELKNALVAEFLAAHCLDETAAKRQVDGEIQHLNMTEWHVHTNGTFTTERPCASLAFDEQHELVLLVPIPKS